MLDGLHADVWARGTDAPLSDQTLAAIAQLGWGALQLYAWTVYPQLSSAGGSVPSLQGALPHVALLALLVQLLEMGRDKADSSLLQNGAAAAGAAVQSGAAAVSSLVSWVSRRTGAAAASPAVSAEPPRARRMRSRGASELGSLTLRLLLLRFADPEQAPLAP